MAEPKENVVMEKIVSLCKRRGFVFPSSEIYGGINGFWDYGPLGAELKRNVKDAWWRTMLRLRDDVVGLEATIIMAPQIWRASGHVDTFSDPMCDCRGCKKRFRADQVEPQAGTGFYFSGAKSKSTDSDVIKALRDQISSAVALNQIDKFIQEAEAIGESIERRKKLMEATYVLSMDPDPAIQLLGKQAADALKKPDSAKDPFAVLVPSGKPPESATRQAVKFYQQLGVFDPEPLLLRYEKLNSTKSFCPECGSILTDPKPFNLMFQTYVGPVQDDSAVAYLRPETAQAIFAQFKSVLETSRQKIPFGIAQMGKAFRNEVTPRNFTFRSREFEQMELEFFIKPDEAVEAICGTVATVESPTPNSQLSTPQPNWGWQMWHKYWVEERIRFYEGIGLPRTTLEEYWQKPEELAHYARATVDLLFKFPFGTQELEGIAARSDFDLSQHQRFSGKSMGVFDEELRTAWGKLPKEKQDVLWRRYYENRKNYLLKSGVEAEQASKDATEEANGLAKGQYIPHVIEPSAGVDRLILALIANAYSEVTETDDKGKSETRVIMKFHPRIAPVKVGVMPLLKNKPELVAKAREVFGLLREHVTAFYDDAGSIGRRYARQDEAGTPFCLTIDFDTLGEKPELLNTVTVRHRDDSRQERVAIANLLGWLLPQVR